jgi:hypothetical protein
LVIPPKIIRLSVRAVDPPFGVGGGAIAWFGEGRPDEVRLLGRDAGRLGSACDVAQGLNA